MKKILCAVLSTVLLAGIFCSCTKKEATNSGDANMPSLKYYVFAELPTVQDGEEDVFKKINEYVKEKINVDLNIEVIGTQQYEQQMTVKLASKEKFDLMFVSPWLNKYDSLVAKGALAPLDELLPQHAAEYYNSIPESWWDCTRIGGKIYGAINRQIVARQSTFVFRKDFIEQTGFDYKNVNDISQLTEFFEKLKEQNVSPSQYEYMNGITIQAFEQIWGYENIGGSSLPGDILYNDSENPKVFNQYETDNFKNLLKLTRQWNNSGYVRSDKLSSTIEPPIIFKVNPCYKPGYTAIEEKKIFNADVVYVPVGTPFITTPNVVATMTAITSSCQNKEKAAEVINLFNTDDYLYNLLCYGIEGRDYEKTSDGKISVMEGAKYSPGLDWEFGNQFNALVQSDMPEDVWQQQDSFNNDALESKSIGFVFDNSKLQTEVANCNAVIEEYLTPLLSGFMDIDTKYDEFIAKLKAAGSDKIIAEKQSQLDEFIKSKK